MLCENRKGLDKHSQTIDDLEIVPSEILSKLECEYQCSSLKKKLLDGEQTVTSSEIYNKALDTLHALMVELRLQKEWHSAQQFKKQTSEIDAEDCVKLLSRCCKMFEAKSVVQRIIKMVFEQERLLSKGQETNLGPRILCLV